MNTLGCRVNQSESQALSSQLIANGYEVDRSGKTANICIINTCAVTQKAAMQSRQAIRKAIDTRPEARIVVTGCYAEIAPEEIKKIKGVDDIVGQPDKHKITELVSIDDKSLRTTQPHRLINAPAIKKGFNEIPIKPILGNRTRPNLKIQDGCNAACTYCIVPRARGRSRSLPSEKVLQQLSTLSSIGHQEVVLSGIHLGCYGWDLEPKQTLLGLMEMIEAEKLNTRIRLSSIEPGELSLEIINQVASSDTFCSHFHIPLQSGDSRILKQMRRPYSPEEFKDTVTSIHTLLPDAAIGADVLIGFPGEDENAFRNTYDLIHSLPIAYLHVFPFSVRPGTPAAKLTPKISDKTIKKRCRLIRKLGVDKKEGFYQRHIGKTMPILIESQREKKTRMLKGMTPNYMAVLVNGGDDLMGKIKMVRLSGVNALGLLTGKIESH